MAYEKPSCIDRRDKNQTQNFTSESKKLILLEVFHVQVVRFYPNKFLMIRHVYREMYSTFPTRKLFHTLNSKAKIPYKNNNNKDIR